MTKTQGAAHSPRTTGERDLRAEGELFSPSFLGQLMLIAETRARAYAEAEPFAHIVIDDFLPEAPLRRALEAYPGVDEIDWQCFANTNETKRAFSRVEELPSAVREVLYFMNSAPMMGFLERLTGIDGLIPDPYYVGGGLHQIERGGKLEVHVDFNRLQSLRLDRRANMILFLNEDWDESYGGHLELWEPDLSARVKAVLPVFNRCVIFSTTSESMHGHPDPLSCPVGRTRKSLATYYYSNGRPEEEQIQRHSTVFRGQKKPAKPSGGRALLRSLLPPILHDLLRLSKGKS